MLLEPRLYQIVDIGVHAGGPSRVFEDVRLAMAALRRICGGGADLKVTGIRAALTIAGTSGRERPRSRRGRREKQRR
jgi:hypothetical protein